MNAYKSVSRSRPFDALEEKMPLVDVTGVDNKLEINGQTSCVLVSAPTQTVLTVRKAAAAKS